MGVLYTKNLYAQPVPVNLYSSIYQLHSLYAKKEKAALQAAFCENFESERADWFI
jgi:hypothetical protein